MSAPNTDSTGRPSHVDGLGAGVRVLAGIVVGVIISIIVRQWEQRRAYDAQFKSLIAEISAPIPFVRDPNQHGELRVLRGSCRGQPRQTEKPLRDPRNAQLCSTTVHSAFSGEGH